MEKKYRLALHIFRRDLRLTDNTALNHALDRAEQVMPCFIFDPQQIEENDYKSDHCIQFMVNSLRELNQALEEYGSRLYIFHGKPHEIIDQLLKKQPIDAVFINRDYTPFSRTRDELIKKICANHQADFHNHADALLHEPEQVHKTDGKPYTVFTPYYHAAQKLLVEPPQKLKDKNFYKESLSLSNHALLDKFLPRTNLNLAVKGGRKEGRELLKAATHLGNYDDVRNFPSKEGTTKLSAHNKFGTLSIREIYFVMNKHFGPAHPLIRALYWRDFFTHISFHFPTVFGHAFQERFDHIKWPNNEKYFRAWCEGRTGFPIVDAGMRELNTTGFMHNRVRMITASFLTKDLHVDWRWGEKYFAQQLVDYDPCVNNGNWQWAASTGCDAQPYFRIFNPWLQHEKFDPECLYVKRWVPELATTPNQIILNLYKHQGRLFNNYPDTIVDHKQASAESKQLYQIK